MNKNYIFGLIAISIVIVIIGAVVLYQSPSMTLDQIIKNKDCSALDKWENDHMFDDDLNISSEQMSNARKLATECVGKVLNNMLGSSNSKTNEYLEDREKDITLVKEIIDNRDCWAIKDLLDSDEISSGTLEMVADNFRAHCDNKAIINDEGIDISNTYELNSSAEFILK